MLSYLCVYIKTRMSKCACMHGWMDGWMDGRRTDGGMEWMYFYVLGCTWMSLDVLGCRCMWFCIGAYIFSVYINIYIDVCI